ncbi:hypothetical protein NSK_008178 [Nannochloropsis salina CCMP1776]|uniref:PPM-type phosphatase domain-containing protein n=1 Tax=Nannochloropsis salina CCMP1776 TaxID=1027361 RepID=A0A4D9CQZ6_9STRA|nr:hypothetical protein NSK_008178 [Nannochloropsis salina CCMP1776]|eukprot:TFJ80437.1 hypothetical protein NSK_008178 [Nannochloropsis salina CCMP1776]
MGAYLSAPVTEKESQDGENPRPNGLRFGVTAMQGWRVKMEDAHLARVCLEEDEEEEEEGQVDRNGREEKGERVMKEGEKERKGPTALFGVFDGHGGSEVANYCAKHLEHVLVTSQAWKGGKREEGKGGRDVQGALKEAFLRLDGMLAGKEGQEELQEMLREEREGGKRPEPEVSLEEVAVQTGLSVGSIRAYVKEAWRRGQAGDEEEGGEEEGEGGREEEEGEQKGRGGEEEVDEEEEEEEEEGVVVVEEEEERGWSYRMRRGWRSRERRRSGHRPRLGRQGGKSVGGGKEEGKSWRQGCV